MKGEIMQIQSVTNYGYKKYQPSNKAHISYERANKTINNTRNLTRIGVTGMFMAFITKLFGINKIENEVEEKNSATNDTIHQSSNSNKKTNDLVAMSKVFEQYSDGSFKETNAKNAIDILKNKPDLLAKWFLSTNNMGENYLGYCYENVGENAKIIHNALKSQPDVLYEIYMTPTHIAYNPNNGYYPNVCLTSRLCNEKSINTVLKNIIDLALNSDLSVERSKNLLLKYSFQPLCTELSDRNRRLLDKMKQLISRMDYVQSKQENMNNTQKFLCSEGAEKYLHTDKEIDSLWLKYYQYQG